MANFSNNWTNDLRPNTREKIKESIKSPQPLKPKVEYAKNKIQAQNQKLDVILEKLRGKEKTLSRFSHTFATWMLIIYNYLYVMQRIEVSGIKQYQHQHTNPNAKFRKYLLLGYSIMTLQFNVILSNYL